MRSLKYSVEKYNFKKNSYYGSVVVRGESNLEDTIEDKNKITNLGDLIENLDDSIIGRLKEGYAINIADFVTLRPTLRGLFNSEKDQYDPNRHNIEIVAEPGSKLKQINRENKFKIKKVDSLRKE